MSQLTQAILQQSCAKVMCQEGNASEEWLSPLQARVAPVRPLAFVFVMTNHGLNWPVSQTIS